MTVEPLSVTVSAPPMVHSTTMKVAAERNAEVTPATKSTAFDAERLPAGSTATLAPMKPALRSGLTDFMASIAMKSLVVGEQPAIGNLITVAHSLGGQVGAVVAGEEVSTPLAEIGIDVYALGMVLFGVSTTVGSINFVVTLLRTKAPGMSINRAGNLALVTNRADNSIAVLRIAGKKVTLVDTVVIGEQVAHTLRAFGYEIHTDRCLALELPALPHRALGRGGQPRRDRGEAQAARKPGGQLALPNIRPRPGTRRVRAWTWCG